MGTPPTIELASLGMADSIILMVLALVVFGPRRLPQIGRQIGKLMYEFRKASNDFKFQMEEELRVAEEADRRKKEEDERKRVAALHPADKDLSAGTPALAASSQASVSAQPDQVSGAQTIEAQADIGAAEPPATSNMPEAAAATSELPAATSPELEASAPRLQRPQTGEPVSAAVPFTAAAQEAAVELNPDADVSANAESVGATIASNGSNGQRGANAMDASLHPPVASTDLDPAASKEPVSQHG